MLSSSLYDHINSNQADITILCGIVCLPVSGSRDFDLSLDMTAELSVAVLERDPSDLAFTNLSAGLTPGHINRYY